MKNTKHSKTNNKEIKSNNNISHMSVSIDFATEQFFQILLMDIKSRHAQHDSKLEPVASAISI